MTIVDPNQAKNLFNAIIRDEKKNIFYGADKLAKTLVKKDNKSSHEKDRTFLNIHLKLEDKKVVGKKIYVPLTTPFVEQKKQIYRFLNLYSFQAPFDHLNADIAEISFLDKSAVNPKYCLLFVDLLTSKDYTDQMGNRSSLDFFTRM